MLPKKTSRLDEIRKRRSLITQTPWTDEFMELEDSDHGVCSVAGDHSGECPGIKHCHQCISFFGTKEDANFIAHAPDDIDYLLALIESLYDELNRD